MESIPLEMENVFDDYDDDDAVTYTRLPDLDEIDLQPMVDREEEEDDEQNADGNEDVATDNAELLAKLKNMKGASKNIARRTFPKLDATRLTGERGIPVLPNVFKDIPLKGKHHEVEDLKVIMHRLEHWAHRLFPRMPFTEVLERVERLGAKKEVQTCVKRIRLGMPVLPSEVAEDDDVQRVGDKSPENNSQLLSGADEDEIERMIQEQEEMERISSQSQSLPVSEAANEVPESSSQQNELHTASQTLPDEVKARIERNKKLAMEKRAARLAKVSSPSNDSTPKVSMGVALNEEDNHGKSTDINPDPSSPHDGQTFESAIEMLESVEDDQDMDMLTSAVEQDSETEKITPAPNEHMKSLKDNSQDCNDENSQSVPNIIDSNDKGVTVNETLDSE